ncbi:MAG: type II toxin-antitoxin system PemK/MazF family toxin [Candidatus Sericytochromatia bacterium]|nr:type II toxin-antitoxin system PemK/MazF family toxin [Candidatus Sericytochromatia bacterium]
MKSPKYFELWYVDWNPSRGSEQSGIRPALIIQNDLANQNDKYPNTIVLAVSTKSKSVSFHVQIKPSLENGLKEISYIKCEQIMTISKERLLNKIGLLENDYKLIVDKYLNKTLNIR